MNNGNGNVNKRTIKTFIFILILIILILLLIKGCPRLMNNKGIKITNIKQVVDSFDDDEIYIKNLKKNHRYIYDVTIHNYLDEDYYLYKVEINNKNITHDEILKLLKHGKDTKVKLSIKSLENIKDKTKIKFYYGKLKEIYVEDEVLSVFGDEKVKLPMGPEKEGYIFLGYSDKKGSEKAKYKTDKEYNLKDGTRLYPVYEKINPKTGGDSSNDQSSNNNQGNNNNNNDDKKEEKKETAKFIVTFDYQNGAKSTTKEVINTEKYGTLPTAVKTGYYFIGWYLGNQKITSESIVNLTSNVTLKAKYNIINYSINYNLDGGSTTNPSTYTVESNDIILSDAQKEGVEFVGWTGSNGDTPEKNVAIPKGSTGNKEYTANYSAHSEVEYKVIHKQKQLDGSYNTVLEETFSAPYGTKVKPTVKTYEGFNSPEPQEITVKQDGTSLVEYKYERKEYKFTINDSEDVISSLPSGNYPYETEITLTAKEKEGYDFSSWSNGETTNPVTITLTENTTIRPIYTAKTYVVEFNANTGTGEMASQTFTYDEEKALNKNTFTKLGNKFIGWNTKADGTGTPYLDEAVVKNLATSGTVTLYAQFIAETYTISFNTDGGEKLFSIERTYGETYGDLPEAVKPGYTFTGWYLGDQKIESTTIVDVTSDTTLKARYNINNYNITYNLDGGSASNPSTYTVEDTITLNNPTKTGYTFSGWTGSNGESLQTLVTIQKGSTGDKTYTAHYSANSNTKYVVKHLKQKLTLDGYELEETENLYGASDTKVTPETKTYTGFTSPEPQEITIKSDGSTELEYKYDREIYTYTITNPDTMTSSLPSGEYPYGTEVTITANTVPGYTFSSWNNGEIDNPATFAIDENLNIAPIYNANTYYVVFNNNTGSGSMSDQQMTYDADEVLKKCTFTKVGYSFDGWNTKADGTGTNYADEATVKNLAESGNVILYAKWKANTDTSYKVITKKQNIDLETYTETENIYTGTTDTEVTPTVVDYTGFVSPDPQTITITGDGNASVTYTYLREMYEFNLPDTENVISSKEPGEYPYGTEIELTAKEKEGYTFDGWSDGVMDNPRTITLEDDTTIEPRYKANTDTSYTVKHYKQKVTLDGYELADTDNLTGTTDTEVTPTVKTYEGFTSPSTQTVTIKGDGTTEVTYNYDRIMYSFNLPDTENVTSSHEPGNYPYGTEITISSNDIPGYTFTEWSDHNTDNPRTISLSDDVSLTPSYSANTNTAYKVEHYKQKITLDGYDLAETDNLTGTTDTEVTPEVKTYTGFTSPDTQTVIIKGDGSTVVTYNYDRVMYTYTVNDSEHMTSSLPSGDYPYGTEVTVTANTVPGYTFGGWNDGNTDNPRTITIDKNISIEPTYTANTNTSYKVEHYKQKVTLDGYDLAETDNLTGTTDTKVTPNVKTYTGFDSPVPTEVTIKGDGTTVVTYNYTRKSYTFTLNDSEDVNSSHQSGSYPYETEITLTAKDKEGYTFVGWSNGDTNQTTTISLTDNIEINPVYSSNTDTAYKVIHKQMNIDGEGYTTYETEILYGTTGSKVTPEVKTYTGFTSPEPEEITITGDGKASVTYNYTRNKYDFAVSDRTYIDEDNSTKNGKYYYQTEISVTAKAREGYTFAGWSNGDNTLTTTFNLDDDTTITPSYTANKYYVVFNSNTGSGTMSDQEMTYNKQEKLTKNTFVKQGYTFAGWNREPDGTGATYEDEEEVKNLATSGNVILYAQWVANSDTPYTVIHKKQNLDMETYTDIEENYTATTNQEITPEVHTYTGFVSPQAQTTTVKPDGSTVVTYIYTRKMYDFTLSNKEDVVSSHEDGSYPYETVITLEAKYKAGYTFTKWSDNNTTNPREITLTGDTNINPIYTANTNTPYKVIIRKENVDGETYTETETTYTGTTDTVVTPEVVDYTGFISPTAQTITITGDGNASVTYTYNRERYTFTLTDTTNVTSSLPNGDYPYETEITLTANPISGYAFTGWSNGETSNPLTITLSENTEISPIYEELSDVQYKVVHRKQKVTLDGYDVEEEITSTGQAGATITPEVNTYTGFISPTPQTTTIKGDGTTVVTYDYDRISYTLTYDNTTDIDLNESTPEGDYPYGYEVTLTAKEKAGYAFTGWSNGETDNPLVFDLTDNVTIKPLYVANSDTMYKVIHRKQNLDLTTYSDEVEERFGTTDTSITPFTKSYTGFTTPQTQTTTIAGDGSTEVIYVYNRIIYTLSLEDTEYIVEGDLSGDYPYGTELTLTAKDRENYVFDRWSNNSTVNPTILTITGNQTVKPIYSSNSYTVTFNANGGTGSMNDQSITKNVKTSLTTNEFTKSDSIFDSWNTETDGSGTSYHDGEEVLNITNGDSITLYAIWAPSDKVARIGNTYYTKLATAISNVPTTGEETEIVLLQDTAEKAEIPTTKNVVIDLQNHTLSNNGNLNVVVNNGTLKLLNGTITTNVAQGAINNNSTGTMVVDGTNIIVSKTTSKQALYNDGGTLTLNNVYFSSESTIRATLHNLNNGSINLNSGTIISTNIYAIYNEKGTLNIGVKDVNIKDSPVIQGKTYGIIANNTYKFYDGIIKGSTYHAGKTSNTGNTPSISNDVDETKISEIETDSTKILGTEDIGGVTYKTLKLELSTPTPTNKTVTFNSNGGTISEKTREVPSGSKVGNLPTPSKNNNHFDGWFTESTVGTEITKDTVINNDVTFYAHWTPTIDIALINPIRIAMKVGQERQIEITGPEGMETVTYTSNDTDVVTVDSTGKVTGISDGITTISITGTVSGITKTIDVEVIPARRFKVTFNSNGGEISETTRYVGEGTAIGDLPTGTKGDLVVEGWYLDITTGIKITSDYIVNNDIVLTPKWREPIAEFTSGEEFIVKIKGLAGTELSVGEPKSYIQYYGGDKYTINEAITPVDDIVSIQKSNVQPDISTMDSNNIVSSENSNIPIYAWFDNGIIYWWTEASNAYLNQDSSYMFSGLPKVQSIDIENMSSVNVTDMSFMFANFQEINTIDLSYLDTRNVTNMNFMFGGSTFTELDLTKLNTSKVTTMVAMFQGTKVPSLDFSESDLRKVENTTDMFGGSDIQEVNFDNVQTDSLTKMVGMFVGSKFVNLDLSDFDTSNVTNMYDIFSSTTTLKTLNMNNWDFSGLTSLKDFYNNGLSGLEEIKLNNANTTTITDMSFMFGNCTNLKKIELDGFDTNNVTNMYYMFGNCTSLTELDLSDFNTSNVTTMEAMFYKCSSLSELDLSMFNTSNVTNINAMFNTCSSLIELNLSNWDLSNINQGALMMNASGGFSSLKTLIMDNAILPSNMYYGFGGLSGVEEISLNNVDTSNVTNMSVMFNSCSSLTELDLSSFDTSEVTNMDSMFNGCSSLTSLDLSMFNTSNVSSMGSMFYYCSSLIKLNLSNWSFVKYPADSIHGSMSIPNSLKTLIMDNVYFGTSCSDSFGSMSSLESISLNNVDTSDVTNMSHMFGSASSIKNLDLRSFDTSKVTNMSYMFDGMTGLESITVSDLFVVSQVTSSGAMFNGDINLVGGQGTVYSEDHIDKEYAHYDMGENFPGYFNSKSMSGEYVISFKDGDKLVDYKYINQGDSIGELPVYVKTGYTLDYWMVDNVQIDNTYTPTQNTTVYAKMTANKYTISFESNGGSEVSSYNRDYGTEVGPLPTPTKLGNTFIGWYKNSNLTSEVTSDTIVTGDMKIYAKWNPYYTVTLNANGGKFDDDETTRQVVYQNTTTEKYSHTSNISDTGIRSDSYQNNLATKDVVTFENAKKLHVKLKYGTQVNYDYVYVFKGTYDGEVTRNMSKGQLKTYTGGNNTITTVEFDIEGNTATFAFYSNASNAYYGYYAVVTPYETISDKLYEEPTRDEFKFVGWNTSQDGTGTSYSDEKALISNLSDKTVYAQWIEASATFDSGYDVNQKMKKLAGNASASYSTDDTNITSIQKSSIMPDVSQMTSDNIVSSSESVVPIYMWYENGTIYWWAETTNTYLNEYSSYMFYKLKSITTLNLDNFDTSKVTYMTSMFRECSSLTSLDLTSFNTSNVTDMTSMFAECSSLTSLDLTSFNTSKLTDMNYMFRSCKKLESLNLTSFNTSKITSMIRLFSECNSLTSLDLSSFNTSNVTTMNNMFYSCKKLESLNLTSFNTSKVTDMSWMFCICESLENLNLSNFNTSSVTNMTLMFSSCRSLLSLDLTSFDTSNVTNMHSMFSCCNSLTQIDLSSFNTSSVEDMSWMFHQCKSLPSLSVINFNTSNVTDMSYMFYECYVLQSLDLSNFNTSNVTKMHSMFSCCKIITSLDLRSFNTSKVTDMSDMFSSCFYLTSVDLSSFDTSKVTDMSDMFARCHNLLSLDLSNFNTSNVVYMRQMFLACYELTSLDLTSFNTSKVTNMNSMFSCCQNLKRINLSTFNTSSLKYMYNMFSNCQSLEELDLSSFDTSKVTNMEAMFWQCEKLVYLDLSSFDTSQVTKMNGVVDIPDSYSPNMGIVKSNGGMFYGCKSLITIYASPLFVTTNITDSSNMFFNCKSIVGGWGTKYSSSNTGKEYARIDEYNGNPGYFTAKEGWMLQNRSSLNPPSQHLLEQEWVYYDNGTKIESGFHLLNDLYGQEQKYYFVNGVAHLGWLNYGGYYYYFSTEDDDGNGQSNGYVNANAYRSVTKTIDGVSYEFDSEGRCINYNGQAFYTVEFDANGGTVSPTYKNINQGSALGTLPTPTREGYVFLGWWTDIQTGVEVTSETIPNSSARYIAKWDNVKTVSFDANNGEFEQDVTSNIIKYVNNSYYDSTSYKEPTKQGYKFTGWNTKQNGSGTSYNDEQAVIDNIDSLNNKELYAKWMEVNAMFDTGKNVNAKMKRLAGNASATDSSSDTNITSIQKSSTRPDISSMTSDNIVSISNETYNTPIYMWYDNGTIYWWSEDTNPSLNTSSSYMFSNLKGLTNIDVSSFDTSAVTDISVMFYNCSSLTSLDLGDKFDTSNVTTMSAMFSDCSSLTSLDLGDKFDTSSVTNMELMFASCSSLTSLDLGDKFDTSKVTIMSAMFHGCRKLTTIYATNSFVATSVKSSSSMFTGDINLVGGWGTTFNSSKTDKAYARIDEYNDNPGYFTDKTSIGIDFDANGGTGTMNMQVINSTVLNTLNTNTFTNGDYVFGGWNTASDGSGTSFSDGSTIPAGSINKYTKLYAQWIDTTTSINVSFNANGGTGTMNDQVINPANANTLVLNSFTNSGSDYNYEFTGWNTSADGQGTHYDNGGTIPANTYSANITLYAEWRLHGWQLINSESVQPPQDHLLDQQWSYYDHGVIKADGFQVLPNLSGENRLYYIENGIAKMGWVKDQDDNWFYFSKLDGDSNNYVDCDAYVNGSYEIDGVNYQFDENGICLNPNASSNVGSSVFGLLYKYDLEHKSQGIILIVSMAVLSALFGIYMFINRKKRIND